MPGLPAANNDPLIPELRKSTNKIYTPIFLTFTNLNEIVTTLSQNLTQFINHHQTANTISSVSKTAEILLKDLNWLDETVSNDFNKLQQLENHIKFLNADETLTNQKEIITVMLEFLEFYKDMVIGNIEEVLNGILTTLKNEAIVIGDDDDDLKKLRICFGLNGIPLNDIVNLLKRYSIVLKIIIDEFKKIERNHFGSRLSESGLNDQEFKQLENKIGKYETDLNKLLVELKNIIEG